MKRIVCFINTLSSGGAEHQLCTLADGLAGRGYDVTIATFGDIPDHYTINPLVKRHHIAAGKNGFVKFLAIWKYFLTVKTDCVIAFCQRNIRFCMEALQFRRRGAVRVIAGERNYTGGRRQSSHERALLNRLYRKVDYIVPNNYAQRQHIVNLKPEYEKKTLTIINYTDKTAFRPSPLPNNDSLRIGILGRYDHQKNGLRFVEAMRIIKGRTERRFVIDWYGNQHLKDGSLNSYYLKMQSMVEEYALGDYIVLHDHVKDVAGLMPLFDAVCLPSVTEGFSNTIGEAICCGKPCLVSDVADNSVMVKDGVNGFLFDPDNEESIAEAFLKFFALDHSARQRMGDVSRRLAEDLFDRNHFIQQYIDLIES